MPVGMNAGGIIRSLELYLSNDILSVSRYVVTIGLVNLAATDSEEACIRLTSGDSRSNCIVSEKTSF